MSSLSSYHSTRHKSFGYTEVSSCNKPRSIHLDSAFKLMRYFNDINNHGIFFLSTTSSLTSQGCTNFEWACCPTTCRSTIGYFTIVDAKSIASLSSKKVEYRDLTKLTSKLVWLQYVFTKGINIPKPISIYSNNHVANHILEISIFTKERNTLKSIAK